MFEPDRVLGCLADPASAASRPNCVFVALWAVGLASVDRWCPDTAQRVFAVRDGLQVRRIDARWVTAQVVKHESTLDRPVDLFVGESVRTYDLAAAEVKSPVPASCLGSGPLPTAVANQNLVPEAKFGRAAAGGIADCDRTTLAAKPGPAAPHLGEQATELTPAPFTQSLNGRFHDLDYTPEQPRVKEHAP